MKRKNSWNPPFEEKLVEIMEDSNKEKNDLPQAKGLIGSIIRYFQEYSTSSSIHGIRYMGEKGRSGTER